MDVRLDTRFPLNPKTAAVGPAARDLFVCSLCYATANLTDGFVPASVVPLLSPGLRHSGRTVRVLLESGLWHEANGADGFRIHDFADYQMTRAQVEEAMRADAERETLEREREERRRALDRERKRTSRGRHADVTRTQQTETGTGSSTVSSPTADRDRTSRSDALSDRLSLSLNEQDDDLERIARSLLGADEGTLDVLRRLRSELPTAAFATAWESLQSRRGRAPTLRNEAGYFVAALQRMKTEGTYSR